MQKPMLWQAIRDFPMDEDGAEEPYSVKLARAEGWSPGFTKRVIGEYRRFLYLTQVAEGQVTPSEIVDRAWHVHLTFTRNYWDELCAKVLDSPLHHEPCSGPSEMPRYEDQFAKTRALYRKEFGEDPPEDVWGGDAPRISAEPTDGWHRTVEWVAMLLLVPFFIASIFFAETALPVLISGGALALFWVFVLLRSKPRKRRGNGSGGCGATGAGCDTGQSGGCGSAGCGGGGCGS